MNALERINGSLFRALNTEESAMILGGQETVHTFVRGGDGTYTYIGKDLVLEEEAPQQEMQQA